jgi:hypothetical protein
MPVDFHIIDCHLHTGVQRVNWGWERIRPLLLASGIRGAAPPGHGPLGGRPGINFLNQARS